MSDKDKDIDDDAIEIDPDIFDLDLDDDTELVFVPYNHIVGEDINSETVTTMSDSTGDTVYFDAAELKEMTDGLQWVDRELERNENAIAHENEWCVMYEIDYDKVKSIEDIVVLLKAIDIKFGSVHAQFDEFKHLLKRSKS